MKKSNVKDLCMLILSAVCALLTFGMWALSALGMKISKANEFYSQGTIYDFFDLSIEDSNISTWKTLQIVSIVLIGLLTISCILGILSSVGALKIKGMKSVAAWLAFFLFLSSALALLFMQLYGLDKASGNIHYIVSYGTILSVVMALLSLVFSILACVDFGKKKSK